MCTIFAPLALLLVTTQAVGAQSSHQMTGKPSAINDGGFLKYASQLSTTDDPQLKETLTQRIIAACPQRRTALEQLMQTDIEGAVAEAFALNSLRPSLPSSLPSSCLETPYDGEGMITTLRMKPMEGAPSAPTPPAFCGAYQYQTIGIDTGRFDLISSGDGCNLPTSHSPVPVHGFYWNDRFVLSNSALRCEELQCHDGAGWQLFNQSDAADAHADQLHARRLAMRDEWTVGEKTVVVFRLYPADHPAGAQSQYDDDQMAQYLEKVGEFVETASYGKQTYKFTVLPAIAVPTSTWETTFKMSMSYNEGQYAICNANNIDTGAIAQWAWDTDERKAAYDGDGVGDTNLRSLFIVPDCQTPWAGLGSLGGGTSWVKVMNQCVGRTETTDWPLGGRGSVGIKTGGCEVDQQEAEEKSFVKVTSHEMGHNNGVGHGSFGAIEYGDPFTLMGAGMVPEAHWLAATKWIWNWIGTSQIVELAAPGNALCDVCESEGTFTVAAHDAGQLCSDTPAALRIYTDVQDEMIWVEVRSLFEQEKEKAMIHWVRELRSGDDFSVSSLENTQLLDYSPYTVAGAVGLLDDGGVPVGGAFGYDMKDSGVVIKVVSAQEETCGGVTVPTVTVAVSFQKDMANNGALEVVAATCGAADLSGTENGKVHSMTLDHPQSLTFTLDCTTIQPPDSWLYIYDQYPMGLDDSPSNAAAQAVAAIDIDKYCDSTVATSAVAVAIAGCADDDDWSSSNYGQSCATVFQGTNGGQCSVQQFRTNCPQSCQDEDICPVVHQSVEATFQRETSATGQFYKKFTGEVFFAAVVAAGATLDSVSVGVSCNDVPSPVCAEGYYMDVTCKQCPEGTTSMYGSDSADDCYEACDAVILLSPNPTYQGIYSVSPSNPTTNGYPLFYNPEGGYQGGLYLKHSARNDGGGWMLADSPHHSASYMDKCDSIAPHPTLTGAGDLVWSDDDRQWVASSQGPTNCFVSSQASFKCACPFGQHGYFMTDLDTCGVCPPGTLALSQILLSSAEAGNCHVPCTNVTLEGADGKTGGLAQGEDGIWLGSYDSVDVQAYQGGSGWGHVFQWVISTALGDLNDQNGWRAGIKSLTETNKLWAAQEWEMFTGGGSVSVSCQVSCSDGFQNGNESGVDCGVDCPVKECADVEWDWHESPWGECSKPCDSGEQTRTIKCRSSLGQEGSLSNCNTATRPPQTQRCNQHTCPVPKANTPAATTATLAASDMWVVYHGLFDKASASVVYSHAAADCIPMCQADPRCVGLQFMSKEDSSCYMLNSMPAEVAQMSTTAVHGPSVALSRAQAKQLPNQWSTFLYLGPLVELESSVGALGASMCVTLLMAAAVAMAPIA